MSRHRSEDLISTSLLAGWLKQALPRSRSSRCLATGQVPHSVLGLQPPLHLHRTKQKQPMRQVLRRSSYNRTMIAWYWCDCCQRPGGWDI